MQLTWGRVWAELGPYTFGVALSLAVTGPVDAQESVAFVGRVLDEGGHALAEVDVGVVGTQWGTSTDAEGRFRIVLQEGEWTLRFRALGYRTLTRRVAVRAGQSAEFRLAEDPLQLKGLTVRAPRTPVFGESVTPRTIGQVPPVGEPDVFRAVVLLPAVSQPNDLKGRIHLAGGSSDETGVRLDGHPLQEPYHMLGLLGAFDVAALERADVLVHHVPPRLAGTLSGVIALETRFPGDRMRQARLSVLTSGGAYAAPDLAGFDLLVTGRISYLDVLADAAEVDVPLLGFGDAVLRLGRSWGGGWRGEVLGYITRDRWREPELDEVEGYRPLAWGEGLVGVRVTRAAGPWELALRASHDIARIEMDERSAARPNHLDSRRSLSAAAIDLVRRGRRLRIRGGIAAERRDHTMAWTAQGLADEIFSPATPPEYSGSEAHAVFRGHVGAALRIGASGEVAGGIQAWRGPNGELWPAPGVRASLPIPWGGTGALSLQRRLQFHTQLEEPIEGSISAPVFLLEQPRRADVAAAEVEWPSDDLPWDGRGTFGVQAFLKRYPDRPVLDETSETGLSGEVESSFPEFDRIRGEARGISVRTRTSWGDAWLLQGSYTYQRVREEYEPGAWSPTAWDAPHTLVLFASGPAWRGTTWSLAYHAHSGRATTPVIGRSFEPYEGFSNRWLRARYLLGERNSIRVPPYHRLDLGLRYGWHGWGASWTLSAQVLNALGRENAVDYDWRVYFTDSSRSESPRAGRAGLPFLPSLGLEVMW